MGEREGGAEESEEKERENGIGMKIGNTSPIRRVTQEVTRGSVAIRSISGVIEPRETVRAGAHASVGACARPSILVCSVERDHPHSRVKIRGWMQSNTSRWWALPKCSNGSGTGARGSVTAMAGVAADTGGREDSAIRRAEPAVEWCSRKHKEVAGCGWCWRGVVKGWFRILAGARIQLK